MKNKIISSDKIQNYLMNDLVHEPPILENINFFNKTKGSELFYEKLYLLW